MLMNEFELVVTKKLISSNPVIPEIKECPVLNKNIFLRKSVMII